MFRNQLHLQEIINVLEHGKFQYPASARHSVNTGTTPNVYCDLCHRDQLSASIGYREIDLCLICADRLSSTHYESLTELFESLSVDSQFREQAQDHPAFATKRIQDRSREPTKDQTFIVEDCLHRFLV